MIRLGGIDIFTHRKMEESCNNFRQEQAAATLPPHRVRLKAVGVRKRINEGWGADLPLYATALVLRDAVKSVAILDVDAIGFDGEWTTKIIDAVSGLTGLPREHIRFSCTHTHSGPNTFRLPVITEGREMILEYLNTLPAQD